MRKGRIISNVVKKLLLAPSEEFGGRIEGIQLCELLCVKITDTHFSFVARIQTQTQRDRDRKYRHRHRDK